MPRLRVAAVCTLLLPLGCGGGGGGGAPAPVDPAVVTVSPTVVWRDGTTTLDVTGVGTTWAATAPPTVILGDDVTPTVTVRSPTSLRIDLAVPYDAVLGHRAVFVTEGPRVLKGPDIDIAAPALATWFSQPFARASVLVGAVSARKPGVVVTGFTAATSWDGTVIPLLAGDPHGFVLVVPETATLGPFDLVLTGMGPTGATTFRVPAGSVRPRTLTFDTFPRDVTLPTVDGTALHRFTATVDGLVELPMTSPDPTLPVYALYPHQGPFTPPVVGLAPTRYGASGTGPRAVALAGDGFDVVVYAGFATYRMEARETPATVVAEGEPNDRVEDARPVALPALVHPAAVDDDGADDWYAFVAGPDDVGRVVRVVASPEAPLSVAVVRADGATVLGSANASGAGGAVDLRSAPLPAAETVYLRVSSSVAELPPPPPTAYRLFVRLEAP